MSHHLDSPLARKDPRLDISDVYLFKGATGTVFVMNVNPQSGAGGFHPEAMYEFKIDTTGDAVEDITFRFTFGERSDEKQTVVLRKLTGADAMDRMAEGVVIVEGVTDTNLHSDDGISAFAGSAGEPFYIEGRVVTAVKKAVAVGSAVDLSDFDPHSATNLFGNSNVSSIVLEVPNDILGEEINFWGTVALATDAGGWGQVQRAATPLMNTLYDFSEVHLNNGEHADYNATNPADDTKNYAAFVTQKTETVLKAMDTTTDPHAYAESLTKQLFPDVLHYQVGSEAMFGVEEQNGRGLTESTPDVMFQRVLNKPVPMGLDDTSATGTLRDTFPYVSLPMVKDQ